MRIRILTILMAAALLVPGANAALTLYLSDGTNSVLITDGGGGDLSGTAGKILFDTSLGNWTSVSGTAISKPLTTNPSGDIDLSSLNVSSSAGGTLTLILADNGWPAGSGGVTVHIGGTLADNSSIRARAYASGSGALPTIANPLPGDAVLAADTGLIVPPPSAFGVSASGNVGPLPAGYTVIESVVLHHDGAGNSSFDGEVVVPEPASLALLGAALLASGSLMRKKFGRP